MVGVVRRHVPSAVLGMLVGLGLGWGLFGGPAWLADEAPQRGGRSSDAGSPEAAEGPGGTAVRAAMARGEAGLPTGTGAGLTDRGAVDGQGGACGACPSGDRLAECDRTVAVLRDRLQEANRRADSAESAATGPRYDAPTASGRRVLAARKGNLLVEFPDWNDRLTLRDGVADEHGLTPAEQQSLEALYADTNARLREVLQKIYADLVGDPQAGHNATTNALLHDLMSLSPQDACNQKLPALLQALAEERPLPELGAEPLPCEQAVQLVFQTVDALDEQAVKVAGEPARKALWSGSSTFEFGSRGR
jgi:hypothetical protein